jgi:hypothetical protein
LSRIKEQYIDTGQVRFVYKHYAILGPESNRTAEASECAAEQDKFWAYHDIIFADQATTHSTFNADKLTGLAGQIGLDTAAFSECLNSGRYTTQITQQSLSVQSLGIRGTPGFLLNGIFISGAQPFEAFQQIIEEQLGTNQASVGPLPATEEVISQPPPPTPEPSPETPVNIENDIEGVVFFPDPGKDHHEGEVEYEEDVPHGGTHSDEWQNCGIYDETLPDEPVVHSLEHGAVWIAYQPELSSDQVEFLRNLVRREQQVRGESLVLLSPHTKLEAPVVATAWQVQLQLDDAADDRLSQFLAHYQNGPFAPEPEAPCTGSIGEPLE